MDMNAYKTSVLSWQERTELLIKKENLDQLRRAHVFVAGLGGVGAFAAEMLCRAGVGRMTIADSDQVHASNRNRQLLALNSTQGERKVRLMGERLLDINPYMELTMIDEFLRDERTNEILETPFDYLVDAIDTLSPKIYLIRQAMKKGLPLVSSMGAGGKLDPERVLVADFSRTHNCNLARMLRKRLKKLGITKGFKAVFSTELISDEAMVPVLDEPNKKTTVGTISYMPAIFGCVCASVVIRDLIETSSLVRQ
jgi:tRNA threonylcarbamoyladenosine dehydratase